MVIDQLRNLLDYDLNTGQLTWKSRDPELFTETKQTPEHKAKRWNAQNANRSALTAVNGAGYHHGTINGKTYLAHRVAFALHHGYWPIGVDHRDGNTLNNRIMNLIEADQSVNRKNAAKPSNNTSGVTGIRYHKATGKLNAFIRVDGKQKSLGYFTDIDAAFAARKAAEIMYGFSDRHGQ